MPNDSVTELRPKLQRAKATLRSALKEACHADLERANTGELIRIEEVLAIANEAAKEAVSVRRRLSTEQHVATPMPPPALAREIVDERGIRWAVFAVVPTTSEDRPTVRERFRGGWLSFDSGEETRRLVPIPTGWQQLTDLELRVLWAQAEYTPRRAHSAPRERPDTPPPSSGL
jgi:hypothetical protein